MEVSLEEIFVGYYIFNTQIQNKNQNNLKKKILSYKKVWNIVENNYMDLE